MVLPTRPRLIAAVMLTVCLVAGDCIAQEAAGASKVSACVDGDADIDKPRELDLLIERCTEALLTRGLTDADKAEVLANRGVAYRNSSRLDSSLADLREASRLKPSSASILRMHAWTLRQMRQLAEAEALYDRALTLEPHTQAYLSRCVVRMDRLHFDKALEDCEVAERLSRNEDSVFFLGWLYAKLRRPLDAVRVLEPTIGGAFESGRILGVLAFAYDAVGRTAEAAKLKRYARVKYTDDELSDYQKLP